MMTVYTKPLTDPEVIKHLKAEGKVLLEVQTTRYFIVEHPVDNLDAILQEWFVQFRGRSHAWRDGSHVGGGDTVTKVKVLTEDGRVVLGADACACGCDCLPCQSCDHK
jgi:hypothetical protein